MTKTKVLLTLGLVCAISQCDATAKKVPSREQILAGGIPDMPTERAKRSEFTKEHTFTVRVVPKEDPAFAGASVTVIINPKGKVVGVSVNTDKPDNKRPVQPDNSNLWDVLSDNTIIRLGLEILRFTAKSVSTLNAIKEKVMTLKPSKLDILLDGMSNEKNSEPGAVIEREITIKSGSSVAGYIKIVFDLIKGLIEVREYYFLPAQAGTTKAKEALIDTVIGTIKTFYDISDAEENTMRQQLQDASEPNAFSGLSTLQLRSAQLPDPTPPNLG